MRFALLVSLLLTGCTSSVWVIEKNLEGGIIGYKNGSRSDFKAKFDTAASGLCPQGFTVVRDRQNSSQGTLTTQKTETKQVDVYSNDAFKRNMGQPVGTATVTQTTPVTQSYTETWREAEVRCNTGVKSH